MNLVARRREPVVLVAPPPEVAPAGPLASLSVRYYPRLWLSGGLWNITRWMTIFLSSYLVNRLTGSPFLVQVVGTSFFLPMFVGGLAAGAISDRFDRRRTVLRQLAALIPAGAVMAVLVSRGLVHVWMIYVFATAVGVGQVVDMTNRRALVNDLVGDRLFGNAMALEALSMSLGNMAGSLAGGAVIGYVGEGPGYGMVGGFYLICFLLMLSIPAIARRGGSGTAAPATIASLKADLREGLRALPSNRPFVSLLGVTVAMNFLFFSFMPMVPVLARRFDVGPFMTGLLASGYGLGMLTGSLLMVVLRPARRGRIYVGGSFVGMACLVVFALLHNYTVALFALVCTGIAAAGFASVQAALVVSVTDGAMRGRAMGLLSMAIGSLPFGMLLLGGLAEAFSPQTAVIISASTGAGSLALWLWRHPEVISID